MKVLKVKGIKYKSVFSLIIKASLLIILCGVLVAVLLYFKQDSIIFYPRPIDEILLEQIKKDNKNVEDISLCTSEGFKINGWLVKSTKSKMMPLVLYFGGNAEEVSHLINDSGKFNGWNIGLINYRGYGLSQGQPSEQALFKDALQIYDYFCKRQDIDTGTIVVMGRSLGTGVAIYVAQKRLVKGVILVTPYDSMLSLAKDQFSFIPVSLILKHKFDSLSRAPLIRQPLLAIIASNDRTIPFTHSRRLVQKWGGKVDLKIIEGEDHNSLSTNILYWKYIKEFLTRL
jgi:pimeloyl-ACP methyl ester carboxylesterase